MHRGDSLAALDHLIQAYQYRSYSNLYLPARLSLQLARLERARGALESAARRLPDIQLAGYSVLHVAEAEELAGQIAAQRGETAAAARAYRNFIALWEQADPGLQPRVAAAREAVRRLE